MDCSLPFLILRLIRLLHSKKIYMTIIVIMIRAIILLINTFEFERKVDLCVCMCTLYESIQTKKKFVYIRRKKNIIRLAKHLIRWCSEYADTKPMITLLFNYVIQDYLTFRAHRF